MTLPDLSSTDFAVDPDSSFRAAGPPPPGGLEVDLPSHRVLLSQEQGLDFNKAASLLLGSPVFGTALFYGKRN